MAPLAPKETHHTDNGSAQRGVKTTYLDAATPVQVTDSNIDAFLRRLLHDETCPTGEWPKATHISEVLRRVKVLEKAMSRLEDLGWKKSMGGYRIPQGTCYPAVRAARDDSLTCMAHPNSQIMVM